MCRDVMKSVSSGRREATPVIPCGSGAASPLPGSGLELEAGLADPPPLRVRSFPDACASRAPRFLCTSSPVHADVWGRDCASDGDAPASLRSFPTGGSPGGAKRDAGGPSRCDRSWPLTEPLSPADPSAPAADERATPATCAGLAAVPTPCGSRPVAPRTGTTSASALSTRSFKLPVER